MVGVVGAVGGFVGFAKPSVEGVSRSLLATSTAAATATLASSTGRMRIVGNVAPWLPDRAPKLDELGTAGTVLAGAEEVVVVGFVVVGFVVAGSVVAGGVVVGGMVVGGMVVGGMVVGGIVVGGMVVGGVVLGGVVTDRFDGAIDATVPRG